MEKATADVTYLGVPFFSIKKMAGILGVSVHTLKQWKKKEKSPPYVLHPETKDRIYPVDAVMKWYAQKVMKDCGYPVDCPDTDQGKVIE